MIDGWKKVQVQEICTKGSSNIAQNKIEDNNGDYPLFGASGFLKCIDFYHQENPYIGIVKDGSGVGRVGFYPAKSSLLGTLQYILPKPGFDIRFVGYALKSLNLASYVTGAAIPHIYFKEYGKDFVCIPPSFEDQIRVVAELDLLNSIIEKKNAQLRELDALAQSFYHEMFSSCDDENNNWEIKCIKDVCTLKSGNSNANNSHAGDLPYVKVGDMSMKGNEKYITTSSQFVDRQENTKGIFPIGTTIFPKRGGAILTNKKRLTAVEICCDLNTMGVIPNREYLHPTYLYQYFLCLDLGALCNGAAIPQLNNCDIGPLEIKIPPMELQMLFSQKVDKIEEQKKLVYKTLEETETLYNSRMAFYFNK